MTEASVGGDRPYRSWSILQLEELASAESENDEVLKALVAELDLRTARRARRLRRKLNFIVSPDSCGETTHVGLVSNEGREPESASACHGPSEWYSRYTALAAKYEALRATFTLEAELLSRWGMTPLLPRDFQDLLFEAWRKRLETSTEGFEWTLETLSGDLVRIAHEREAAKKFNGKNALKPNNPNKT